MGSKLAATAPSPLKVSDLINPELRCWRASLVHDLFAPTHAQAILSIPIPIRPRSDKLIWIPNSKGLFFVKASYKEITTHSNPRSPPNVNWNLLWKFKAPERIKMFLWRVGTNALPTKENLLNRLEVDDPTCLLCNQESESICHLFLKCPIARALWFSTCWGV